MSESSTSLSSSLVLDNKMQPDTKSSDAAISAHSPATGITANIKAAAASDADGLPFTGTTVLEQHNIENCSQDLLREIRLSQNLPLLIKQIENVRSMYALAEKVELKVTKEEIDQSMAAFLAKNHLKSDLEIADFLNKNMLVKTDLLEIARRLATGERLRHHFESDTGQRT